MEWKSCMKTWCYQVANIPAWPKRFPFQLKSNPINISLVPRCLLRWVQNACLHSQRSQTFTAAVFINAETWKPAGTMPFSGWTDKWWCIQTIKYHSALKRYNIKREATWGDSGACREAKEEPVWGAHAPRTCSWAAFRGRGDDGAGRIHGCRGFAGRGRRAVGAQRYF